MKTNLSSSLAVAAIQSILLLVPSGLAAEAGKANLKVDWGKVAGVSKTTPTLQVVVNPMLKRGSPIHDRAFQALRDLGCDYVRYVPWLPYPKLGVAALKPPEKGQTFWDFSLIDPITIDFLEATAGHSVMLNFSTIPQWMFKTDQAVSYPADPDQAIWNYTQGTELRDPSLKELADYYARLVSWYTRGGFEDESGKRHNSKHQYKIDYWEVFNEPDFEHQTTPEQYTARYDAIVAAIQKVAPQTKFVGVSLAAPSKAPRFFEYFLNPKNHKPGIPLDMLSYHFYAVPAADQTLEVQKFTFFEQADKFLDIVRYIESIRQRLSPKTGTTINEIGSISAEDLSQGKPGFVFKPIPNAYWNLSAAVYAYLYVELARLGIDVAGESQLVGYPTQFPSVSMVDWSTGQPNARYWVLKLLRDNFGPGDKFVDARFELPGIAPYVDAQGFLTHDGKRKILLVNKRDRTVEIFLPAGNWRAAIVDQTTGFNPPASSQLVAGKLTLKGLGVAVVTVSQ